MDETPRRAIARRDLLKMSLAGAGAVSLAVAGGNRLLTAAQSTPAAATFDAAACYTPAPGSQPTKYDKVGDGPFTVALSNSYIGNVWRTEMIKLAKAYTEEPTIKPLIKDFTYSSSGNDAGAQIAQIENMISAGAQAIIINAANATALAPVVQKARQRKIVVVSFDNVVEAPDSIQVNEDQVEMGTKWAEWLVTALKGKGNVLMVNGVAGTPVDADRRKGAQSVWDKNPNIKVIAQVNGDWDPGKAQTVTSNALAAHPDIQGVWCQGGTDGVVRAFQAANKPLVPVAGEAENGFRKQLLTLKDKGLTGISIGQTPALVAVSIHAALDLLQGKEVPSKISAPLPIATSDDLKPGVNVFPDLPDNLFVDVAIPACGIDINFTTINEQKV